jgi:hypothetical protein
MQTKFEGFIPGVDPQDPQPMPRAEDARLAGSSLRLLQATERALMKLLQRERGCAMTGDPCRDPAACACFREKADQVLNEF